MEASLADRSTGREDVDASVGASTESADINPDRDDLRSSIVHLKDINVLSIRASGKATLLPWRHQLEECIKQAQAHSCTRYLVDYRDVDARISVADQFNLPEYYAKAGLPHTARVALILREDYPGADFIELVAENRGYQVRAFSSPEPAIAWLTR